MKKLSYLSIISMLFIVACSFHACGGGSENSTKNSKELYFIRIEGSSLNDDSLEGIRAVKLLTEPIIDQDQSGTGKLIFKIDHGNWLIELMGHHDKDIIIPKIEIFHLLESKSGIYETVSKSVFESNVLSSLEIGNNSGENYSELVYEFKNHTVEKEAELKIKSVSSYTKSANPITRFLKLPGIKGSGTIPGYEGAFNVSNYRLILGKSTSSSKPGLYVTIPGIQDLVTLQNFDRGEEFRSGNAIFTQISSSSGNPTLILSLQNTITDLPDLTSDDNGENLSTFVYGLVITTTLLTYNDAGLRIGELSVCYGVSVSKPGCISL